VAPRPSVPAPRFAADPASLAADSLARVDPDAPIAPGKGGLWPVRPIVFPMLGPVTYDDGWGDFRSNMPENFHLGVDLVASKMQPQVAAASGTLRLTIDHPTAGWGVTIVDDDGWEYRYFHLNNDTPGTNDGAAPAQWRLAPGLGEGSRVRAGQLLAFTGNSGDSETGVAHLHFEIRRPGDLKNINPFPSIRAAEFRTRCDPPATLGQLPGIPAPIDTDADVVEVTPIEGVGSFRMSSNGTVFLVGSARDVGSSAHRAADGACPAKPVTPGAPLPPPTAGTQMPAPAATPPAGGSPVATATGRVVAGT
jgi:murein DD-endopeptidase MepM/ murein hydrolase activator NlpD